MNCREKIIKFMLDYSNNGDRGIIGYHLSQHIGENYPTVKENIERLLKDGILVEIPYKDKRSKNVKCKYELQPFYYDEGLFLEMYNFLVPYLEAINKESAAPFDAKIVLRTIFNEVLDNTD